MTRIEEIEKRCEAATPGHWIMVYTFGSRDLPCAIRASDGTSTVLEWSEHSDSSTADVELMSHSREDIPYLLAKLKRAVKFIKDFRQEHDEAPYDNKNGLDQEAREFLKEIGE